MDVASLHEWLSRMPTRRDLARALARAALGIIFCTAVVTSLIVWWLIRH